MVFIGSVFCLMVVNHNQVYSLAAYIIHGFNGGTVLQSLVRSGLESKRIKEIRPGGNSGQTIIILKQGEK